MKLYISILTPQSGSWEMLPEKRPSLSKKYIDGNKREMSEKCNVREIYRLKKTYKASINFKMCNSPGSWIK